MKVFYVIMGVAFMSLASCKGETTACDCAQGLKDMMVDYGEANMDQDKKDALNKKYESLNADCEKISTEMGQEEFNKAVEACN